MEEHIKDQSKRIAQHKLAGEFVELVHGVEAAQDAERQHRRLFNKALTLDEIRQAARSSPRDLDFKGVPKDMNPSLNKHAPPIRMEDNMSNSLKLPRSLVVGQALSRILWSAGMAASRSEGQRLVNNRGAYIGGRSDARGGMDDALSYVPAIQSSWEYISKFLIEDNLLILRVGKWNMKIIHIISDEEYEAAGLTCPGWKAARDEHAEGGDKVDEKRERRQKAGAEREKAEYESKMRKKESPFGKVVSAQFE